MKFTINKKISSLKFKKPSRIAQAVLMRVVKGLYYKQCNVTVNRSIDLNKYKDVPVIIVSNHASRMDYAFVEYAMKGRRLNFVAAENEFHRTKFKLIFSLAHTIPKKNFVPDITTIRGMSQILRRQKAGAVCIFPCGMSTISGAQQPSMLGTGKMLKHFGVHVLGIRIHGGYMVSPKFDIRERYGKVDVELFELFTPEQLKTMEADDIRKKVDEAIFTDDLEWNKTRKHAYKCDWGCAYNLDQLLFECPVCGEHKMKGEGNEIKCLACGNAATLNNAYELTPQKGSRVPATIVDWYNNQRRAIRRQIQASNGTFVMEEHVKLGVLPPYDYMKNNEMSVIAGDGTLRLTMEGLSYTGTRDGAPFEVFIKSENINVLCIPNDGSMCYTYASGEFLEFVPDSPSSICWSMAVEEVYRANGGKWQNYDWFDYENDAPLIEG